MPLGEQRFLNDIFGQAVGLIIALALLVLDNGALIIELFLGYRAEQMAHPVAFEEERAVNRCGRHGFEIIGAVKPGCTVEIGRTNLLKRLEKVARRIFRAVEHQMFKQMRKTGFAARLILRSDMIPDRHRNHGCLAIRMNDDTETVGQRELAIRNLDRLNEIGDRRDRGSNSR